MRAASMKGISVNIGDYGWIQCKGENEKYSGWFLRAKVDGKVMYISRKDNSFMFPDKIVSPSDDYILYDKISALDALRGCDFPELSLEDIELRNLIIPIKRNIETTEKELQMLNDAIIIKNKTLNDLKAKLYDIEHGVVSVKHYVYGVHGLNENLTEYCWENNKELELSVGDVIEVETGWGIQRAIITRLEDSKIDMEHKKVLRKIDKLP